MNLINKYNLGILFGLSVIFYMLWNTGNHGDDYTRIFTFSESWSTFFDPSPYTKGFESFRIPNYYLFYWIFPLAGYENQWAYDVVKYIFHIVSLWMIFKFINDYHSKDRSILFSLIFVFFPTHETTTYWYMTLSYCIFTPAFIFYCHHLYRNDKIILGFILLLWASFSAYSSPPIVFGCALIFFFERMYKKALLFSIPGFIYTFYYIFISSILNVDKRIDTNLEILKFVKNFLIQIFSSLDSFIGPSFWIKIFYSITSISFLSLVISIICSLFLFILLKSKKTNLNTSLLLGLTSILLLSYLMFSITSFYPHTTFNLGNRVTIYASLIAAYFLSNLNFSKKNIVIIIFIFILPTLGLSDYWKNWNKYQKDVINNVFHNNELKSITKNDTLIIYGDNYSKLGPFSHIEFFNIGWLSSAIFSEVTDFDNITCLTDYMYIDDNKLIDRKTDQKIILQKNIFLYDSKKNIVSTITINELSMLIKSQNKEIRHWIQFNIPYIKDIILYLSPRLGYLF